MLPGPSVMLAFVFSSNSLRMLSAKKHAKIKLQRLRKMRIWIFGSLVHQSNSFWEVLKLANLQLCVRSISHHSVSLSIGFWQQFWMEAMCFQSYWFQLKSGFPVFWNRFLFPGKFVSKLKYWKRLKLSLIAT